MVQPGTVLLSLVPRNEPLMAEVSIRNEDIGFVRDGQAVRLKLATYPFQKYGTIGGAVTTVIADSSQQDAKRPSEPAADGNLSARTLPMFKAMLSCAHRMCERAMSYFCLPPGCSSVRKLSRDVERCSSICCRPFRR